MSKPQPSLPINPYRTPDTLLEAAARESSIAPTTKAIPRFFYLLVFGMVGGLSGWLSSAGVLYFLRPELLETSPPILIAGMVAVMLLITIPCTFFGFRLLAVWQNQTLLRQSASSATMQCETGTLPDSQFHDQN